MRNLTTSGLLAAVDDPFTGSVASEHDTNAVTREHGPERLWRPDEAHEIAAQLLRPHPPIISITGMRGSGRTSLIDETEQVLARTDPPFRFNRLKHDGSDAGYSLQRILDSRALEQMPVADLIVIDDLDTVARLGTRGPDVDLLDRISLAHRHDGALFLVALDEETLERLSEVHPELSAGLRHVRLRELNARDLRTIIPPAARKRAASAGLAVGVGVVDAALAPAAGGERNVHPGLAIDRIDAAIGRAKLQHRPSVEPQHLQGLTQGGSVMNLVSMRPSDLADRFREAVRGQDDAVGRFATYLAPALSGLKLRTEQPHGVFLFTGPSGVGKTELAKQAARVIFGTSENLIRLDMSEYGNAADGRAKLVGAHRSWKNSSTEGLLTTKVVRKPRSLVLLDEFEKSSPEIWPLFLQVFDEGRLTDGWGQTASFAETIIVLTSNIGLREAQTRPAGFGADRSRGDRQIGAVREALPTELLNRITAIVPFAPLSKDTIRELAQRELARARERFTQHGWDIRWSDDVPEWLATTSYDPAYGARHLHRTIGQELLPLLSSSDRRSVTIAVDDERLAIHAVE